MHLSSTDNPHTKFQNTTNVDNLKRNPTELSIMQASKVKNLPTQENWSLMADCRSTPELGLIPATVPNKVGPTENIKVHLSTGHALAGLELLPARIYCKRETLSYALKLSYLGSQNPETPWRGEKAQYLCVPLSPRPGAVPPLWLWDPLPRWTLT